MPSHASGVETFVSPTPPAPMMSVQSAPMESARMTFFARPNTNSSAPCSALAGVQRFAPSCSWSAISRYLTIGPTISCGKKSTYTANVMKFFSGAIFPVQTSTS